MPGITLLAQAEGSGDASGEAAASTLEAMVAMRIDNVGVFVVAIVGVLLLHIFAPEAAESTSAQPFLEK